MSSVVLVMNGCVLSQANLTALGLTWTEEGLLMSRFMPMEFDNGLIDPILYTPKQQFEAEPGDEFRYPAWVDGKPRPTECRLTVAQGHE